MRIGLVEFLLILAIASLTIGPQVALFVDRWMRRANRANARAARRRAEYAAQMAVERDALLKRFRTASTVFGVCILLALVYALVFRPIDTPPQGYTAPDVRQGARGELVGHGETHDLAARGFQPPELRERGGDIVRVRVRHRLHGNGIPAADGHAADTDGFRDLSVHRRMILTISLYIKSTISPSRSSRPM